MRIGANKRNVRLTKIVRRLHPFLVSSESENKASNDFIFVKNKFISTILANCGV